MVSEHLESLEDASREVLECRDLGHNWHWYHDDVTVGTRGQIVMFLSLHKCGRCRAERRRRVEVPSMRILGTTIVYPEGYLAEKGKRWTRADTRAEYLRRITGEAVER